MPANRSEETEHEQVRFRSADCRVEPLLCRASHTDRRAEDLTRNLSLGRSRASSSANNWLRADSLTTMQLRGDQDDRTGVPRLSEFRAIGLPH